MNELSSIQKMVFGFLSQYRFEKENLDYSVLDKHIKALQVLSDLSNTGVQIFDISKLQIIFFSSNFGKLLGYQPSDYEALNYRFFEEKIHPDDRHVLACAGLSALKMLHAFTPAEKLDHKIVYEYRMRNSVNAYVRLIEQYQILELDNTGQMWLMFSLVDISPDQEAPKVKACIHNFRIGQFIPIELDVKPVLELTRRELEILKLVKEGYLSKEISDILSISVHTVNTHRYRCLEKLGANNSLEAVIFASRHGLLD
jgi:DNA-binding CsgD family transcriptional regulator